MGRGGLYYRILNGNDGPGSAGSMGKWLVRLAVDRRRSRESGSQDRVTLPQRSLQGREVVAVGVRGWERD